MPLSAGTRLGPYEIVAQVGGEVYKARDTRLDRTVAVKISAEQFTSRFESEARFIAAGKSQLWSETRFTSIGIYTNFDLAPDGKRFAVLMAPDTAGEGVRSTHVTFLLNFFDELRRRAPAK